MFAPQISSHIKKPVSRRGFTLVELLVVITVIAILVALLLPAVQAVRKSVFTSAIAGDMAQLDAAIERFHNDYGFYPSDFSEFVDATGTPLGFTDVIPAPFGVTVETRLLQMLNKISPSHNESAFDDPNDGTRSRLQIWWENVGMGLAVNAAGPTTKEARLRGPQVAAWFWTTQLFNDAQYPLTGPRVDVLDPDYYLITPETEHKVFYDFPASHLEIIQEVNYPNPDAGATSPTIYQITRPLQRGGDAPLVYFHHRTYVDPYGGGVMDTTTIDFAPGSTVPDLGMPSRVPGSLITADPPLFLNAKKFQIVTAGYDEGFGDLEDSDVYENLDNVCNFSEGRLDAFVDDYISSQQ